jgi:pyruvate formate lyase activating enzyme
MLIGGLEHLSLLDYPDNLSAIIFTQGCNFRCHFCYNPMLVWPLESQSGELNQSGQSLISEADLFDFLKSRVGKLDGVVISGGEPTVHRDLPEFIKRIRELGFLVKLDTNGTNPEMLQSLINDSLVDYVAMDIKAPWDKYEQIVGVKVDTDKLTQSALILQETKVPCEFRSTLAPAWHSGDDLAVMAKQSGAKLWYLQKFFSDKNLVNAEFENSRVFTDAEMDDLFKLASQINPQARLR